MADEVLFTMTVRLRWWVRPLMVLLAFTGFPAAALPRLGRFLTRYGLRVG